MIAPSPKTRIAPDALQTDLPIPVDVPRVLVTINGLRQWEGFRGYDEDQILWFIQSGYLVAFNIALDTKESSAEWRIFPDSAEWLAKNKNARKQNPYFDTWHNLLFQTGEKQSINTTRAKVILNCGPTHVTNLIDSGLLKQIPGTTYRRGRAAVITCDSFLAFLKSRLEGTC
jgi:hypothetical protein